MPTIIILDDEPEVLSIVEQLLSRQGWRIFTSTHPRDMLSMMQQHAPDVVITDIRMPGMSGIDVLHQAKLVDPLTEVILITGYASTESAIKGLNEGAFAYLRKPFESLSMVVTTVARALDKRRAELRGRQLLKSLEQAMAEIETTNKELLSAHLEFLTLAQLVDVGRQLLTIPDQDSTLRFTANRAREIMNADACVVWLRHNSERDIPARATSGIPEATPDSLHLLDNSPVALHTMERGLPFFVENLHAEEGLSLPSNWKSGSTTSLFAAPLILHKKPQGALVVYISEGTRLGEKYNQVFALLAGQVSAAIESAKLYENLEEQYLGTVSALATAMEARDPYTSGHSRRVARYAARISEHMGFGSEQISLVQRGGILHDIGKIGIPDHILLKPSFLTEEEWVIMQQHPVIGTNILQNMSDSGDVNQIVLHHHERMDGTGYPDGLVGEDIPILVRILSVADGFEAMISKRAYRQARSMDQALAILREGAGSQWDAEVVKAFHSYLRWKERDSIRQMKQIELGYARDSVIPQIQPLLQGAA